jgi:hypothetical protein
MTFWERPAPALADREVLGQARNPTSSGPALRLGCADALPVPAAAHRLGEIRPVGGELSGSAIGAALGKTNGTSGCGERRTNCLQKPTLLVGRGTLPGADQRAITCVRQLREIDDGRLGFRLDGRGFARLPDRREGGFGRNVIWNYDPFRTVLNQSCDKPGLPGFTSYRPGRDAFACLGALDNLIKLDADRQHRRLGLPANQYYIKRERLSH